MSAFFDLLTPDYPDNTCQFLTTITIVNGIKLLKEIDEPSENVDGLDDYIN